MTRMVLTKRQQHEVEAALRDSGRTFDYYRIARGTRRSWWLYAGRQWADGTTTKSVVAASLTRKALTFALRAELAKP